MQLSLWNPEADRSLPPPPARSRPRHYDSLKPRRGIAGPTTLPTPQTASAELERAALRYEQRTHTDSTRERYQRDWEAFERWCTDTQRTALPATWETLRLYLTHLAELGRAASTIRHARKCIGLAHAHAGQPRPDRDERIRTLERGIAKERGCREVGVDPLLAQELPAALAALGDSPRDDRDRAMILLGFAGAFRAADLAGFNVVCASRRRVADPLGVPQS